MATPPIAIGWVSVLVEGTPGWRAVRLELSEGHLCVQTASGTRRHRIPLAGISAARAAGVRHLGPPEPRPSGLSLRIADTSVYISTPASSVRDTLVSRIAAVPDSAAQSTPFPTCLLEGPSRGHSSSVPSFGGGRVCATPSSSSQAALPPPASPSVDALFGSLRQTPVLCGSPLPEAGGASSPGVELNASLRSLMGGAPSECTWLSEAEREREKERLDIHTAAAPGGVSLTLPSARRRGISGGGRGGLEDVVVQLGFSPPVYFGVARGYHVAAAFVASALAAAVSGFMHGGWGRLWIPRAPATPQLDFQMDLPYTSPNPQGSPAGGGACPSSTRGSARGLPLPHRVGWPDLSLANPGPPSSPRRPASAAPRLPTLRDFSAELSISLGREPLLGGIDGPRQAFGTSGDNTSGTPDEPSPLEGVGAGVRQPQRTPPPQRRVVSDATAQPVSYRPSEVLPESGGGGPVDFSAGGEGGGGGGGGGGEGEGGEPISSSLLPRVGSRPNTPPSLPPTSVAPPAGGVGAAAAPGPPPDTPAPATPATPQSPDFSLLPASNPGVAPGGEAGVISHTAAPPDATSDGGGGEMIEAAAFSAPPPLLPHAPSSFAGVGAAPLPPPPPLQVEEAEEHPVIGEQPHGAESALSAGEGEEEDEVVVVGGAIGMPSPVPSPVHVQTDAEEAEAEASLCSTVERSSLASSSSSTPSDPGLGSTAPMGFLAPEIASAYLMPIDVSVQAEARETKKLISGVDGCTQTAGSPPASFMSGLNGSFVSVCTETEGWDDGSTEASLSGRRSTYRSSGPSVLQEPLPFWWKMGNGLERTQAKGQRDLSRDDEHRLRDLRKRKASGEGLSHDEQRDLEELEVVYARFMEAGLREMRMRFPPPEPKKRQGASGKSGGGKASPSEKSPKDASSASSSGRLSSVSLRRFLGQKPKLSVDDQQQLVQSLNKKTKIDPVKCQEALSACGWDLAKAQKGLEKLLKGT